MDWMIAIAVVSALLAVFLADMALRGLLQDLNPGRTRCFDCERARLLPLPIDGARCFRCRHVALARRLHLPTTEIVRH